MSDGGDRSRGATRVLVTGGAGTIGSHVVDQLVEGGAARDRRARQPRPRPPGQPRLGARPTARSDAGRGRHPRPRAGARADRGQRPGLPPGRDPHHPVRRGAAAGARGAGRRHVQRARGGRRGRGRARSSPSSSASVYGLAEQFPTTERHHPYNNDTFYGAAKAFNEGMLRSFHAMYGLDYVALRYFNVYGPRMDIHGVYTEVLVRWMERIDAGEPPLILGDGLQTMDFVHVADIARANILAAEADVTDDVFNIASGAETSLRGAGAGAARGDGVRPGAGARPGPRGQRRSPAAWPTPRAAARASSASGPRSTSTTGLAGPRRLVAGRARRSGDRSTHEQRPRERAPHPGHDARCSARRRPQAAAEAVRSGWVAQGPRVAEFEQAFAATVGADARRRGQLLHDRPAPGAASCSASARATRSSCRRSRSSPPPTRCATSARRRSSPTSTWPPATSPRRPSTRCAPTRTRAVIAVHQGGVPVDVRRAARRRATDWGIAVVEDAACAAGSTAYGPAGRRRRADRGLVVPPAQDHHHRRGRHGHHRRRRVGGPAAPAARARHERVGGRPARQRAAGRSRRTSRSASTTG